MNHTKERLFTFGGIVGLVILVLQCVVSEV